jgi:hypothetical protein
MARQAESVVGFLEKTLNTATAVVAEIRALERKYLSNRPGNLNVQGSEMPMTPAVTTRPALSRVRPLTSYLYASVSSAVAVTRYAPCSAMNPGV